MMIETFEIWILIGVALIVIDFIIIGRLFIGRIESRSRSESVKKQERQLLDAAVGKPSVQRENIEISNYARISQLSRVDPHTKRNLEQAVDKGKFEKKCLRKLASPFETTKIEAIKYLSTLATPKARMSLENKLKSEKNGTVRLYIANGLADIGAVESIPVLTESLLNASRFYRDKVNMLISDFGEVFHAYLPVISGRSEIEIKELIVDFGSVYFSEELKNYLINLIDTRAAERDRLVRHYGNGENRTCIACIHGKASGEAQNSIWCPYKGDMKPTDSCRRHRVLPVSVNSAEAYHRLVIKACHILADYYPREMACAKYLEGEDPEIKNIAVMALANFQSPDKLDKLLFYLRQQETARGAVNAIAMMTETNPAYFNQVIRAFLAEDNIRVKKELVKILALKTEYFIMRLTMKNNQDAVVIVKEILQLGRTSEVIDFLNKNNDINIENELIAIIRDVLADSRDLETEFASYLDERLLLKCGLIPPEASPSAREDHRDRNQTRRLLLMLLGSFLLVPAVYVIRHWQSLFVMPVQEQLKYFVMDFNYYIAFYALAINLVYLVLLVFSYVSVSKQERLWNIKETSFLFKKKMLPSISIIAPAFNEEKTIIESVNSLLNLKYPDHELIIVNDGSKDQTLSTLIRYYDLKRVDYLYSGRLNARPVRGVYLNRSRPKLIVVDKINGGKADSLNVGINIANKEYVCGIDADSLLEEEALLKLASLTLDQEMETPALGGNILPINGCTVEHGQIETKGLAKSRLARFQTIEYIRSFMSGRLGWSYFNCLLIISGAFGLFRKERVIDVGGYLTSSGKYQTDTVGEDMELVVRIARQMKESRREFKILYAYNANCWTEVPEDLKTLKKQRYRWHRGLIEILTFHRKMLFNPSYGRIGVVAMPYFFIFEMLGPLFEFQGYAMVVLSMILGILNYKIAIILFISVVLMGLLVSVSSLLISEKNGRYFSNRELITLIIYAVLENFGVRQYFSLWRFGGYLNMFKKPTGWQKAERKGFTAKQEVTT